MADELTLDTTKSSFSNVVTTVQEKYNSAVSWATWAKSILENNLTDLDKALSTDNLKTIIDNILGLIDSNYTSSLMSSLKTRLETDLNSYNTGLGEAVETALFARETARQNAARAAAYTEITTQFSARGFDMPPGALLAKQTELNNESNIRLSDSSSQIMAESARLAADYNKHILSVLAQLSNTMLTIQGELTSKAASLQIEAAMRQLQLQITTLQSVSQSAAQMIASSLNGVSVSTSLGYSGQTGMSTSYGYSKSAQYPQKEGTSPPWL